MGRRGERIGDQVLDVLTPLGAARATIRTPRGASRGLLVLGHGAGGGVEAADLVAVTASAVAGGGSVAGVEQPWRVAGKRVAPAPARLDVGWLPVLAALAPWRRDRTPLVVGGRSAGARVACRTAVATGATGVLCLSFPLHPPGRPERSRLDELALPAAAGLPVLVVQGVRDAFGTAADVGAVAPAGVRVVGVPGDHSLKGGSEDAARAVTAWLAELPRGGARAGGAR
jgi:predicted alpha/beta-hydrolase family hydrolase